MNLKTKLTLALPVAMAISSCGQPRQAPQTPVFENTRPLVGAPEITGLDLSTRKFSSMSSIDNEQRVLGSFGSVDYNALRGQYQALVNEGAKAIILPPSGRLTTDEEIQNAVADITIFLYAKKKFKNIAGVSRFSEVFERWELDCDMATLLYIVILAANGLPDSQLGLLVASPNHKNRDAHFLFRAGSRYYEPNVQDLDTVNRTVNIHSYDSNEVMRVYPHSSIYPLTHPFASNTAGILESAYWMISEQMQKKNVAYGSQMLDQAMRFVDESLTQAPNTPELHNARGSMLELKSHLLGADSARKVREEAIAEFGIMLAHDSQDFNALRATATLLTILGRNHEALQMLQRYAKAEPAGSPDHQKVLGEIELDKQKLAAPPTHPKRE